MPDQETTTEAQSVRRPIFSFTGGCDLPWAAEVGALLMRLYFGIVICRTAGISKFPLDAWFAGQVEELGFPMPMLFAWLAAMSEVAGGMLLALGLGTRISSFLLTFTLGVAVFHFHQIPLTGVFSTQHITLKYFWVFLFFTFAGAGRLSLDGLLRQRQAVAVGLAVALLAGFTVYCGSRTAEPSASDASVSLQEALQQTPETSSIVVAGSFNEWSLTETPLAAGEDGVWTATLEIEEAGPVAFKFVAESDWNLSAGDADQTDARFPLAGNADPGNTASNIEAYVPDPGEYRITLSAEDLAYTFTPIGSPSEEAQDASASPTGEPSSE